MSHAPVMTIDGPSGSGKGTVSRAAARALGWALLDSGALYRLVALAGRKAGVRLDDGPGQDGPGQDGPGRGSPGPDGPALARLAERLDLKFGSDPAGEGVVWLDGQGVASAHRAGTAGEHG